MTQTDSFIDEVTEEVRRDQLFARFRKYGWIGIVVVVLIVAGAAYNEWNKARVQASSEAFGDALLAALNIEDAAARAEALAAIPTEGEAAALKGLLAAGQTQDSDPAAAAAQLDAVANDAALPVLFRDLAALKAAMLRAGLVDPETRIDQLTPLTIPGRPYRLLAEEQIALAEYELGLRDAAIDRLNGIMADSEVSEGLRGRASQLIVFMENGAGE